MLKAKFYTEQQPVKIVKSGNKAYVFICLNGNYGIFIDNESGISEDYIEYDYNEFVLPLDDVTLEDIKANPLKYLNYSPELEYLKLQKQEENKELLKKYLENSTVEFNGKEYGVSEEDQTEMALNYTRYKAMTSASIPCILEWHSKKKGCVEFTEEEFLSLIALINSFVYPVISKMQTYKEQIFSCCSIDELNMIKLEY